MAQTNYPHWRFFGRFTGSKITGKRYGECFAFSFLPHEHNKFTDTLLQNRAEYESGVAKRAGGWELYRKLMKKPANIHRNYGNATVIDDWTDDFDLKEDYENWMKNYRKAH